MTKIECIIRPNNILEIKDAFDNIGIYGMTVTEAIGCGLQKRCLDTDNWNTEYNISLLSKIKIEVVVVDELVDKATHILVNSIKTGLILRFCLKLNVIGQ